MFWLASLSLSEVVVLEPVPVSRTAGNSVTDTRLAVLSRRRLSNHCDWEIVPETFNIKIYKEMQFCCNEFSSICVYGLRTCFWYCLCWPRSTWTQRSDLFPDSWTFCASWEAHWTETFLCNINWGTRQSHAPSHVSRHYNHGVSSHSSSQGRQ